MGMSYDEMVEKVFGSNALTGESNTAAQVAAVAVLLASEAAAALSAVFSMPTADNHPAEDFPLANPLGVNSAGGMHATHISDLKRPRVCVRLHGIAIYRRTCP
jgi:hypothetical protein